MFPKRGPQETILTTQGHPMMGVKLIETRSMTYFLVDTSFSLATGLSILERSMAGLICFKNWVVCKLV